ncbi:hypothetical protein WK25_01260 [Burkholderia latens]|nr:hypothetical protein WK25_01260 [Burkholderia latens]
MRCVERAARFHPAQDRENFRRFDLCDRSTTQPRKNVFLETSDDLICVTLRPARRLPCKPLARDSFETVRGALDRRRLLHLALNSRIDPVGEKPARLVPAKPCFLAADLRVDAQRQALFLAGESILEPPILSARRRDFQIHAGAICQAVRLLSGGRIANFGVSQGHSISVGASAYGGMLRAP